jgi:MmgE/PrpD C-terminal domain
MISTKPEAGARASTIVSAPLQMGLAAFNREGLYDIERADAMRDAAVLAFAHKVEIVADDALLDEFPAAYPAEVELTANGKPFRKRITVAAGDPTRPLDDAAIARKAERVLTQLGSGRTAAGLVALGLGGLADKAACRKLADAMWNAGATVGMLSGRARDRADDKPKAP